MYMTMIGCLGIHHWRASSSLFVYLSPFWGAGMAQWREHSPPTNVARVRFPDSTLYVG